MDGASATASSTEDTDPDELKRLLRTVWARANGVAEDDLRAVFDAMDEGCASREEFFEQEFGLAPDALARLRDTYLE